MKHNTPDELEKIETPLSGVSSRMANAGANRVFQVGSCILHVGSGACMGMANSTNGETRSEEADKQSRVAEN